VKLGVLGDGQLARMLRLAATPLDIEVVTASPPFDRVDHLDRCDVVTVEMEAIPIDVLERFRDRLSPRVEAITASADRRAEKHLLRSLNIPTAPFDDEVPPDQPCIVKTRRGGYDGRGQVRCSTAAERAAAIAELPDPIVEGLVAFDREVSVIGARSASGDIAIYPLIENVHVDGILRTSTAPVGDADPHGFVTHLLDRMGYVGVVTLELFDVGGELVANEFAPRVHNSGHWTIEGAVTSQFEQHVRAVCGLPLGDPSAVGRATMTNIIGELPDARAVLAEPGVHLHLYGKEPRPGRKLGHITRVTPLTATTNRG
jgi:5-(carboxyamino)imidazole ribonucleotide synthase